MKLSRGHCRTWLASFLLLSACQCFVSCADDEQAEDSLRISLAEGLESTYSLREVWTYVSADDLQEPRGADSVYAVVHLDVMELSSLFGQTVRRMRERTDWYHWDDPGQSYAGSTTDLYYQEWEDGLYLMARSGPAELLLGADPGGGGACPDAPAILRRSGIPGPHSSGGKAQEPATDELILEDPPVLVLAYPLEESLRWTYREAWMPFSIAKEVQFLGELDPDGEGSRLCARVAWDYDMDNNGEWDGHISNLTVYDVAGMVSNELRQDSLPVVDEDSGEALRATVTQTLRRVTLDLP